MRNKITEAAIKKAGGLSALAKELEITHAAVWQWTSVPVHHVNKVAKITQIPREVLRPDIFGKTT